MFPPSETLATPETAKIEIPQFLTEEQQGTADSIHSLTYYRWGRADAAQTVLCVHGLTRNGRDFDALAGVLSHDYQALCPDMPGRGQSAWLRHPSGYNNATYLHDIMYLLQSLNVKQVHWVGTSMGGILGMMAAHQFPDAIHSLVLNDIGSFIPAPGLMRIREAADAKTSFMNIEEAERFYRMRCATFGIQQDEDWRHLFKYGLEKHDGLIRYTYDPALFTGGFSKDQPVQDISLWSLWESVARHPVLLIRGEDSDILTKETACEMQSKHPDLTLKTIAGVGHAPMLMSANETALIQDWISAQV